MALDFETDPEYQAPPDGRLRLAAARAKYAEYLEREVGNQ